MSKPGSSASLKQPYGNRWALLVGVDHYADGALSNLSVCAGDVQAAYDVLTASGYSPDQVRLLLSPDQSDPLATRGEVLSALVSLAQSADEDDLLLFYFSGHGIDRDGTAYLLPSDTRYTAIADTAIDLDRVKQIMQESAARAKVMVLDACHSGAQIGKGPPEMTEDFIRHVFEEAEGLAILASCKQRQVSWEWPEQGRSVFTHYLLEGLLGAADRDQKGFVTVNDVSRYVTYEVKSWAFQRSLVQTPNLQCAVAGDIVLITYSPTAKVATAVTDLVAGSETGVKEVEPRGLQEKALLETSSSGVPRSPFFIYGPAVQHQNFLNRENELSTIFRRLRNGESVSIVGEPRIGKTSLLLKLADRHTQRAYLGDYAECLLISYLDLHPIGNDYSPYDFWEEALEPLWEHPDHWITTSQFKEVTKAGYPRRSLDRLFSHLGRNGQRLVLLLDEFERLLVHPSFGSLTFFALLRSLASRTGGLVLVAASRESTAQMNHRLRHLSGSPFFNIMVHERLPPFDDQSVDRLLGRAGDAFSFEDCLFIRRVAGRHPFLLQAMAAALLEASGEDRPARAAKRFYRQIGPHFGDVWSVMDDYARTALVVLTVAELAGCTGEGLLAPGRIERADRFGLELRNLVEQGWAERIKEEWPFNCESLLLWQGERWTVGPQAFAWWVRDVFVARTRRVPACDEWLADEGYRVLLTREDWEQLMSSARSTPECIARDVESLAASILEELVRSQES